MDRSKTGLVHLSSNPVKELFLLARQVEKNQNILGLWRKNPASFNQVWQHISLQQTDSLLLLRYIIRWTHLSRSGLDPFFPPGLRTAPHCRRISVQLLIHNFVHICTKLINKQTFENQSPKCWGRQGMVQRRFSTSMLVCLYYCLNNLFSA